MTQQTNFSVHKRNPGHWDITTRDDGRIFRIRGGPSNYKVYDERPEDSGDPITGFKTIDLCMSYICSELMFEVIVVEQQPKTIIKEWNLS